jgi:LmbE family N-acetylglucosaminyl deacetylase
MLISAHADDNEAAAGGTVYRLVKQGTRVVYLIVTNGDKGCQPGAGGTTPCEGVTPPQIATMRRAEAHAAADRLGVAKLILLDGYDDGMLYSYSEVQVREQLTAHVRAERADVVMTWMPYPEYTVPHGALWADLGFHTDHQATGRHVLDVVRNAAGNRFTFPDAGPPVAEIELYLWDFTSRATHYVDITGEPFEAKVAAQSLMKSQYPKGRPDVVRDGLKAVATAVGERLHVPALVEAFTVF